ncbi:hypothetical protein [Rhodococcus sp. SGAir0479]|uniref:hypothetical protein n=1 Tax=Rhodococcus sp. SGAir0479 TaxID=2567884 RepID=UPI0010CD0D6E|nr:hypothetical protein [Rhodococcus sp. SGAir0479]QCQ93042.1 hypothetical protein E7742_18660 [Rhodococcus sp. SGAir0479]
MLPEPCALDSLRFLVGAGPGGVGPTAGEDADADNGGDEDDRETSETVDDSDADAETSDTDTDTDTLDSPRASNDELETQLRTTTEELDTLRGRLDIYERREAEQAATKLADPKDLWVAGIKLDELRGEDGTIDPDKVAEATTRVVADHPGWAKRRMPLPDRRQGGGQREAAGGSVESGRMTYLERKRNRAS